MPSPRQLDEYFDGYSARLRPAARPRSGSDFQRRVWQTIATFPTASAQLRRGRDPRRRPRRFSRRRVLPAGQTPSRRGAVPSRRRLWRHRRLRRRHGDQGLALRHEGSVLAAPFRPDATVKRGTALGLRGRLQRRYAGQVSEGKALLETTESLFRRRLSPEDSFPRITSVATGDGALRSATKATSPCSSSAATPIMGGEDPQSRAA